MTDEFAPKLLIYKDKLVRESVEGLEDLLKDQEGSF
jgi:hypothetical protein